MMEHFALPQLSSLTKNATTNEILAAVAEVRQLFPDVIRPAHEKETIGQQTIALAHALIEDVLRQIGTLPEEVRDTLVWFVPTLQELKDTVSLLYNWSMPARSYATKRLEDSMTILLKCLEHPDVSPQLAANLQAELRIIDAVCTYFYQILFISYGHAPEYLPR